MRDIIIFSIVGALVTTIMIGLVVVPNPTQFTSYAALSFALVLDAIPITCIIFEFVNFKEKPKTVSPYLSFWLAAVLYCCLLAVSFLTDGYIKSQSVLVLVFDCIFGAMGLAAFIGLAYQIIACLRIKYCLKFGKDATAEFVSVGKDLMFGGGRPGRHTSVRYSVNFKYCVDSKEMTAKSKRVFSREETQALQAMETFNIKYTRRTAVINEIVKTDTETNKTEADK